jgi:hypothetical protein
MFIGDFRTKHPIRAFRSPNNIVDIPKDATPAPPLKSFPAALRIMARNLHIFEYRGETLYMHEAHGLMGAITEVELDPFLET